MKISRKVAGLAAGGVVVASGAAYAAVETTSSSPTAKNVSSSHRYGASRAPSAPNRSSSSDHDFDNRSRSHHRTPKMWMSGYYNVVHVHKKLAVIRLSGHRWRRVGWLKRNSHHIRGVAWPYRYTTTVIVLLDRHKAVTLVVRPNTVIVVATNGQIGIVPAFYLQRWTPQRTMSPTPTPTMTTPASPTPTPTGSQSAIVNGLQGRNSPKW